MPETTRPVANTHANALLAHRISTFVCFAISIYFTFAYTGLKLGHHPPNFHVKSTPFSADSIIVTIYWVVLFVMQLLYITQFYSKETTVLKDVTPITWHFNVFNLLHALWIWLFSHKHRYFLSELVLIVNLINLFVLYIQHRPYAIRPLSKWFTIHPSTTALPLSWVMYAIFWNGAVLFHSHKGFFSRILSNLFIWDFLLVPALFLLFFRDWAIGYSTAVLVFAIAIKQMFVKLIALQWIFAFVIAGTLTLLSTLAAIPGLVPDALATRWESSYSAVSNDEQAPLLHNA